jgi:hypothetical protein
MVLHYFDGSVYPAIYYVAKFSNVAESVHVKYKIVRICRCETVQSI